MRNPVAEAISEAFDVEKATDAIMAHYVVVCLGGLAANMNDQPQFMCKVYGPFAEHEAREKQGEIMRLEGGAVLVRPLVDLADTYRRLSAD